MHRRSMTAVCVALVLIIFLPAPASGSLKIWRRPFDKKNLEVGRNHLSTGQNYMDFASYHFANDPEVLPYAVFRNLEKAHQHLGRAYRRFEKVSTFPEDDLIEARAYLQEGYRLLRLSKSQTEYETKRRQVAYSSLSFIDCYETLLEGAKKSKK